ncbi:MAG: DNA polymerase I [Proteobacteria bacterium]|nr:DNA polymerase I [Pseudomonadota bacterium]
MKKTLFLIDGSAYIYRGYHALPSLSNSKGLPTNAILGFTNILYKLMNDKKPEYAVMLFDEKGPTFRHHIYKEYKANRPPMPEDLIVQLPYIREVVKGFNIPVMEMVGYEADDLIGTLAALGDKDGFSVVMISGDKDLMQLITDNVSMYDPMKDIWIDKTHVLQTVGVVPEKVVDVMGLTGDTSDNIPGVPGIGKKTAPALIQEYGSLENLYEHISDITKKKLYQNLVENREKAFLSRDLATIKTDIPMDFLMEDFRLSEPNSLFLATLFSELEFRKYQKEFSGSRDHGEKKYLAVLDKETLLDLAGKLTSSGIFALDTETTSKDPMRAKLVGFSFSMVPNEAYYIPCGHTYDGAPEQLDFSYVSNVLKPVLENPDIKKVGQNIKYDWMVLKRHGIFLEGVIFDTMIASYLIHPSRRSHSLDQIAMDFLNYKMVSYEEVAGKGKNAICFSQVELDKAVFYASEDADITFKLYDILLRELDAAGLYELFNQAEMPLVPVLMDMEMAGIHIDAIKLAELSKTFAKELETLQESIFELAGSEFNINSSQQLGYILFETLGLPVQKKTKMKTGYSTDVDVLTTLSGMHELPRFVLRHRTLSKLKSTYADSLVELIHPETRRIHTSFNQTVTVTGRLSSSDPNLQNIPIRTEEGRKIRSAFIPREGWLLLSADYSQIELRILAHYANDIILIDAFNKDEDIHTRTASEVFQVFPSFITEELRRQAKAINFGIIYGMSAFGLSKELGISRKMAQEYIHNYFLRYKGVKAFIDQTIERAKATEKTSTLLGRIRRLPDINSPNSRIQQFAERAAINTPIQGSAADLVKLAMIRCASVIKENGFESKMLLSVHDEIIFEVPQNEIESLSIIVKEEMEGVWSLKVPLKVNIGIGKNWSEAH